MVLRYDLILHEIREVLETSDFSNCDSLIKEILKSKVVILYGAGRVGLAMRAFAKRLRHLGVESFFLEDTTVPVTGATDLLILGSGSGATPTVLTVAEVAARQGLQLGLITTQIDSPIAKLSKHIVVLNAPSKMFEGSKPNSIQPMTTLFEQSLNILLDALVLRMMELSSQSALQMKQRHNVIE